MVVSGAVRFDGTCTKLVDVDVRPLRQWISGIDFAEWPQQHRLADGGLRPAMVTDLGWHGFGRVVQDVTVALLAMITMYSSTESFNPLLSVVMPGHKIDAHRDEQQPDWICRVHVPIVTNTRALMRIGGEPHHLAVGTAYLVNTMKEHSVENLGDTPRVHYMFDVRR